MASVLLLCPARAAMLDYEEHLQRAQAAQLRGDWQSVASQFALALNHPELPRSGPDRLAALLGYGRAMGALCQFAEAENYLLRALEAATAGGLSPRQVLAELGALQEAQGRQADAARSRAQLQALGPASAAAGITMAYGQRCPAK